MNSFNRVLFGIALLTMTVVGRSSAAPVTDFISFAGSGTLPALGVFTYDASTPAFSNFFVAWNGTLFDLTSSANAPSLSGPCPGESSSPPTGFALMSQSLCAGSVYNWSAHGLPSSFFTFQAGGGGPNHQVNIFGSGGGSLTPSDGFGTWTIMQLSTSVPEPGTLTLLTTGVLLCGLIQFRKPRSARG